MSLLSEVYPIKNNFVTTDLNIFITSLNDIRNNKTNKFLNVKVPCSSNDIFTYEIFNGSGRIIGGKINITNNLYDFYTISIPIDINLQYFVKVEFIKRSGDHKIKCLCKFFKHETDNNEFKLFPHYTDSDEDNCDLETDNDLEFCNNFIKNISMNSFNERFIHNSDNIKCINIDSDEDSIDESDKKSESSDSTNDETSSVNHQ